jgi:integrase/recombinase XerC
VRAKQGIRQVETVELPGTARSLLAPGVALLQPQEAVLEAMLTGWSNQQTSRLLAAGTVEQRTQVVRRFVAFTNDYPWRWTAADAEEWTAELVARGLAHSTIRHYQQHAALFMAYLTDARYGWDQVCEQHFGTHPMQVFHEWNTAVHRSEVEARPGNRPLSREELQELFDFCDQRVATVRRSGRKGWLAAYRDAAMFKTMYAWGLRRRETARLETVDWSSNHAAPEFGRYGAVSVRYGKAMRGSPPRRRTVLTTMGWAAEAVAEWVEEIRPAYGTGGNRMWPTERGGRVSTDHINARFAAVRDALGLDPELGPHCLRHSYVSHLLEDGFDHLFVQQQAGHAWGSTTAIYTTVGSDYKNKALRRALDRAFTPDPRSGSA